MKGREIVDYIQKENAYDVDFYMSSEGPFPGLLSLNDTMTTFGVSKYKLRELIDSGQIREVHVGLRQFVYASDVANRPELFMFSPIEELHVRAVFSEYEDNPEYYRDLYHSIDNIGIAGISVETITKDYQVHRNVVKRIKDRIRALQNLRRNFPLYIDVEENIEEPCKAYYTFGVLHKAGITQMEDLDKYFKDDAYGVMTIPGVGVALASRIAKMRETYNKRRDEDAASES